MYNLHSLFYYHKYTPTLRQDTLSLFFLYILILLLRSPPRPAHPIGGERAERRSCIGSVLYYEAAETRSEKLDFFS